MALSPATQKQAFKPIAFLLDTGTGGLSADYVTLYIRPEELTVTSPARSVVHQTLGGAWIDNYGAGIKRITISGTTGWHPDGSIFGLEGGLERFKKLQSIVYDNYFASRKRKIEAGEDPAKVKVIFIDRLNEICSSVSPVTVTLKRSKNRPLLHQYNIVMDVVEADADSAYVILLDGLLSMGSLGALGSLSASISSLSNLSNGLSLSSGLSCLTEIAKFGSTCVGLYQSVHNTYKNGGILPAAMSVSSILTSSFGTNICQTAAGLLGVESEKATAMMGTMANMMKMAGTFGNIYCLLNNAFKYGLKGTDYSSILGASFCSSTSGGASLSQYVTEGVSVFDSIFGTNISTGSINISSAAAGMMSSYGLGSSSSKGASDSAVTALVKNVNSGISKVKDMLF